MQPYFTTRVRGASEPSGPVPSTVMPRNNVLDEEPTQRCEQDGCDYFQCNISMSHGDRLLGLQAACGKQAVPLRCSSDYDTVTTLESECHGDVIVVRRIFPGKAAWFDGTLCPGDRLLAVNGTTFEGLGLDEAIAVLKAATQQARATGQPVCIQASRLRKAGQMPTSLRARQSSRSGHAGRAMLRSSALSKLSLDRHQSSSLVSSSRSATPTTPLLTSPDTVTTGGGDETRVEQRLQATAEMATNTKPTVSLSSTSSRCVSRTVTLVDGRRRVHSLL
eukprot:m.478728 g.478728  ORF g.478728 m.478728 type:complete len:277 (-) comp21209_c0_seq1:43-873(-)